MEGDVVTNILMLILGAALALMSNWVLAWIERETSSSNELFNRRINGLNDIWRAFVAVKDVYGIKATKGHAKWLEEHKDDANNKLNEYRHYVDINQVVLPKSIIDKLREIDTYMNGLLWEDKQNPSQYVSDINARLAALSEEANKCFKNRTHAIDLYFRT